MLAGASEVVEETSAEELDVDVVAWAEETDDDIDEKLWEADDAEEELRRISIWNSKGKNLAYLSMSLTTACIFFPSRYLPNRSPILTN